MQEVVGILKVINILNKPENDNKTTILQSDNGDSYFAPISEKLAPILKLSAAIQTFD